LGQPLSGDRLASVYGGCTILAGCGLARGLKAALLRQVHACHPEAKVMSTCNAEVNAPILSINARVGFAVRRRIVDYQITRTVLDGWCQTLP
jgi:hypothetical protein